jgi:hypothetical protein
MVMLSTTAAGVRKGPLNTVLNNKGPTGSAESQKVFSPGASPEKGEKRK